MCEMLLCTLVRTCLFRLTRTMATADKAKTPAMAPTMIPVGEESPPALEAAVSVVGVICA